jgi:hypothetical protein
MAQPTRPNSDFKLAMNQAQLALVPRSVTAQEIAK